MKRKFAIDLVAIALATSCMSTAAIAGSSAPPAGSFPGAPSRLNDTQLILGLQSTELSKLQAATAFANAGAGFIEPWSGVTNWTGSATPFQVSAAKMYSNNSGGASGGDHAWALGSFGTTQTTRAQVSVTIPASGSTTGGVIFGVDSDTAGVAPSAGAAHAFGIYLRSYGSANTSCMVNGGTSTVAGLNPSIVNSATYVETLTVNAFAESAVAYRVGDANFTALRCQTTRATVPPNNLFVFNSDNNQLTGFAVNPLWAKQPIAAGGGNPPEYQTVSGEWNQLSATQAYRLEFPIGYDPRVPYPLIICFHGNGTDENFCAEDSNMTKIRTPMLTAGAIILGVSYVSNHGTWGQQASLDAYYAAYSYVKSHYAIGPVAILANSMGGIESLLFLADRRVSGITAWVGTSPTYSLWSAYANQSFGPFLSTINTAYGITSTTLTASASAGATTISANNTYPAGTVLAIGAAQGIAAAELDTVASVSGTGPFTITLSNPLTLAHSSGDSVSDYGTKTAGHDPALYPASAFKGVPMAIYTASDDAAVDPVANGQALATAVRGVSADLFVQPGITGGHSFNFATYATGTPTYNAQSGTPNFMSIQTFLNKYLNN